MIFRRYWHGRTLRPPPVLSDRTPTGANEYTMKYRGRLSTAEEFGELVVKSLPGGDVLRLKEVADIELGDEYYNYSSEVNGHPAAMAMVYQTAGSNAAEIINEIDATLEEISQELPKDGVCNVE